MPAKVLPLFRRGERRSVSRVPDAAGCWNVVPELQRVGVAKTHALSPALVVSRQARTRQRWEKIFCLAEDGAEVATVAGFAEAAAAMACRDFAVAVVDAEAADALELIALMRQHTDRMRVLAIASFDRDDVVMAALHAGASGYVAKEREDVELILSLKSLQRGGTPIDPNAVRWILSLLPRPPGAGASAGAVRLSVREVEVLQLLARGFSNRDIADLMSLSRLTVEGYVKSLYRKLDVGSRTAAVFEAQRQRLLP